MANEPMPAAASPGGVRVAAPVEDDVVLDAVTARQISADIDRDLRVLLGDDADEVGTARCVSGVSGASPSASLSPSEEGEESAGARTDSEEQLEAAIALSMEALDPVIDGGSH